MSDPIPDLANIFGDVGRVRFILTRDCTPPVPGARLLMQSDLARSALECSGGRLDALDRVELPNGMTVPAADVTMGELLTAALRPRTVRVEDLDPDQQ